MDLYALVRTIVQEVLDHTAKSTTKPYVLVLGNRDESLALKVLEHLEPETVLVFSGEAPPHLPCRWVLPFLSCDNMAKLAAGKASGAQMPEVLQLLLGGTKIEVLEFEYRAYSETAPEALYSLYKAYEKTLATFGLTALRQKQSETIRHRDSLVTAASVKEASQLGALTLMVPIKATITPLALETAKDLNVTIQKRL